MQNHSTHGFNTLQRLLRGYTTCNCGQQHANNHMCAYLSVSERQWPLHPTTTPTSSSTSSSVSESAAVKHSVVCCQAFISALSLHRRHGRREVLLTAPVHREEVWVCNQFISLLNTHHTQLRVNHRPGSEGCDTPVTERLHEALRLLYPPHLTPCSGSVVRAELCFSSTQTRHICLITRSFTTRDC